MVSRCALILLGGAFLLCALQLLTIFHLELKADIGHRIFPVESNIVSDRYQSLIPFWKDTNIKIGI
jgi:hypothetical protein